MKKILFIVILVISILVSVQAADQISFQVNNTSWEYKTRLACCVDYPNVKKEFTLILDETTDEKPITIKLCTVPKGDVQSIKLDLTNYHPGHGPDDLAETVLADLVFTPTSPTLLRVTFTIKGREITHEAVYG